MEIKSAEKYFRTERRKDFVKLCFVFLPESDEYLSDVKRAEALIGQKIDLHKYRCFYSGKGNEIAEAGREEDVFSIAAGTYFLLPLKNRMQTDDFRKNTLGISLRFPSCVQSFLLRCFFENPGRDGRLRNYQSYPVPECGRIFRKAVFQFGCLHIQSGHLQKRRR